MDALNYPMYDYDYFVCELSDNAYMYDVGKNNIERKENLVSYLF